MAGVSAEAVRKTWHVIMNLEGGRGGAGRVQRLAGVGLKSHSG